MELELKASEAQLLTRILSDYLGSFRMEIVDTENSEWRESMKQDEVLIKDLLKRLGHDTPAPGYGGVAHA